MKSKFFLLGLFGFGFCSIMMFEDDPQQITSEKTSIFLDSLDNEIELIYVNGKPSYYKSEIFTPVCNTGECLPVFVNIYWKLSGAYLRYDQPNEKILTKLDHEPFTEADYRLLDLHFLPCLS